MKARSLSSVSLGGEEKLAGASGLFTTLLSHVEVSLGRFAAAMQFSAFMMLARAWHFIPILDPATLIC